MGILFYFGQRTVRGSVDVTSFIQPLQLQQQRAPLSENNSGLWTSQWTGLHLAWGGGQSALRLPGVKVSQAYYSLELQPRTVPRHPPSFGQLPPRVRQRERETHILYAPEIPHMF